MANPMRLSARPSQRKRAKKAADTAFSLFIRARDGWRCVTCGETDRARLQCGHLFSSVSTSTRYDELNAHCQCGGCNVLHEHDPYPYQEWFKARYGEEAYHGLYLRSKLTVKLTAGDLLYLAEHYRAKYRAMEGA